MHFTHQVMYAADTLSRATHHTAAHGTMEQNVEGYLTHVITETIPVSSNRLNQIKTESLSDETMKSLLQCASRYGLLVKVIVPC